MKDYKMYNVRINFFWDEGDDMQEFKVFVPGNTSVCELQDKIINAHNYLSHNNELYGTSGRNPETLLEFVCEQNGWKCEVMAFDIDLNFD